MSVLTERDLQILRFIAKFGYCLERQIASLCDLSLVQTVRIINRLTESGYINKLKVLSSQGSYLLLTKESGKLLDVKVANNPNLNTLNHDTLLVDLYFYIIHLFIKDVAGIKTDKEIRRDLGIFKENEQLRVPDLLINEHIAIELELSEKPKFRLQEIINTYIVDDNIRLVCYFLKDKNLLKKIYDLTLNNYKFRFYLFEFDLSKYIFTKISAYQKGDFIEVNPSELFVLPQGQAKHYGNFEFK